MWFILKKKCMVLLRTMNFEITENNIELVLIHKFFKTKSRKTSKQSLHLCIMCFLSPFPDVPPLIVF